MKNPEAVSDFSLELPILKTDMASHATINHENTFSEQCVLIKAVCAEQGFISFNVY
jgi:hypothetical protein